MPSPFFTSGIVGASPTTTYTGTTTDGAGSPFKLLQLEFADDGSKYIFVQANGAITQYSTVWITTAGQAAQITETVVNANPGGRVGFAQSAFADNEFGWVVLAGSAIRVRFADSCAKGVPLYTTTTAGVLDDATASASQYQIMGVVIETVSGNTPSNALASASFPSIRRPVT